MPGLAPILDTLESCYGRQAPDWPTDPYLFLVWWHCGYPPGEERCDRAPGADRILLFGRLAPVAAVPSASPHVLVRIASGREGARYAATYREAQRLIEAQLPATFAARNRAYLLLRRHARELCTRRNPGCGQCPVAASCAYFVS